jgi:DNA-binding winged helix-turn-helix (wHTH) protein
MTTRAHREWAKKVGLEIRVLGRVDALVDGQPLPLGGSKQRAILAMLALRANRTVSADDLIDGLWGDRPPASAAKNVQLYISRLRKALGADGSGATIVTRGRGYELQLPTDAWTRRASSAWSNEPGQTRSRGSSTARPEARSSSGDREPAPGWRPPVVRGPAADGSSGR